MNLSESESFPALRHEIAGVPVRELAREFGTPSYFYDASAIERRIDDLRAFDVIRYAQKACSNLAILDLVRRHGVLVDAVSAGEIGRALAAGYVPDGRSAADRLHRRYLRSTNRSTWSSPTGFTSTAGRPT